MSSQFQQFKNLHASGDLFVLPNVWDAASAHRFQENKFPAIATSSAAVAGSLGYDDGEHMLFSDYLFVIRRILSAVTIPLSVDIEMGYGVTNEAIYSNIMQLIDLGVAGINIEDSVIHGSSRTLKDAKQFAETINFISNRLSSDGLELFINIRCDTFILDVADKQDETLRRLKIYNDSGAGGIFLPCITAEEDITAVVHNTRLPLNVMAIPGLPGFDKLEQLGVRRVSMGPFLFSKAYDHAVQLAQKVVRDRNISSILS